MKEKDRFENFNRNRKVQKYTQRVRKTERQKGTRRESHKKRQI